MLILRWNYPSVQCAAVRTQSELISVPPQNCKLKMLEPVPLVSATCQGASPQPASVPPTIFVKFPFLMGLPFFLDPEQATQVPPWAAVPQVRVFWGAGSGFGQHADVTCIWKNRVNWFILARSSVVCVTVPRAKRPWGSRGSLLSLLRGNRLTGWRGCVDDTKDKGQVFAPAKCKCLFSFQLHYYSFAGIALFFVQCNAHMLK